MLDEVTRGETLTGLGLAWASLLMAFLVLVQPVLGRRKHARLVRELTGGRADGARRRFYRRTLLLQLGLLLAVLIALGLSPGLGPFDGLVAIGVRPELSVDVVVLAVSVLVLAFAVLPVLATRHAGGLPEGGVADVPALALVPVGKAERRTFAGLSVTAGVVEEVVARGLALLWVASVLPGLPVAAAVVLTAVAFGLGHAYQGVAGVVVTGLLGLAFAVLYVASGSLLLPIVLHALVDLRILLLPQTTGSGAPSAEAAR
jgi:uncharacterized protein